MSEKFKPLAEAERIKLIKAALLSCGEKVTKKAVEEQFYRETREYPKSGLDQVEAP